MSNYKRTLEEITADWQYAQAHPDAVAASLMFREDDDATSLWENYMENLVNEYSAQTVLTTEESASAMNDCRSL